jgi:hypothetical protein
MRMLCDDISIQRISRKEVNVLFQAATAGATSCGGTSERNDTVAENRGWSRRFFAGVV